MEPNETFEGAEGEGPETAPGSRGRARVVSVVLFGVGVLMLGAAVWTLSRQGETLRGAWEAARGASPVLLGACVLLPVVNWLATGATIWVLIGRHGRVGFREMSALVGAAWLLNMLPMRPGMVGRVAYHKKINGIRVMDSVRVIVVAMGCTAVALGSMLAMVALAAWTGHPLGLMALAAGPPVLFGAVAMAVRRRTPAWRWSAAVAFRYFDMLTWAVRYTLVFSVIGHPVGVVGGAAMTAVGQVAMMTPVQFGVREWAVGLASMWLPEARPDGAPATNGGERLDAGRIASASAPGLLADCCMRAAELVVVLPVGLCSSAWVVRRMRAGAKAGSGGTQEMDGPAGGEDGGGA